jgi:hypothetical protein
MILIQEFQCYYKKNRQTRITNESRSAWFGLGLVYDVKRHFLQFVQLFCVGQFYWWRKPECPDPVWKVTCKLNDFHWLSESALNSLIHVDNQKP